MIRILYRSFSYLLFWTLFFLVCRAFFLGYQHTLSAQLSSSEMVKVFLYGFRMDVSFAAYLSVLPFLFLFLNVILPKPFWLKIIKGYTYVMLPFMALLVTIDLELYTAWGYRLDATPLQYLNTPREMIASTESAPVVFLLCLWVILAAIGIITFKALYASWLKSSISKRRLIPELLLSLFMVAFLILPIRGGLQQIPLNQSDVYFSQNVFANHAGVNIPWNMVHSIIKKNYSTKNPYIYQEEKQAKALVQELYLPQSDSIPSLLNTKRPNVLFVILESYTAKYVGSLGGEPDVTPNLNALSKEGLLFSHIYASGDRSEKGMVALLSGYPVQPTSPIIKTPRKTERLPHLAQELKKAGYSTSFYYGGELAFANIKSYLLNGGYDKLVEKSDFPRESYNSKWGVHDHILFDSVQHELKSMPQPFLATVYTLSSHEPYESPISVHFKGEDEETKFKNVFHYTDWAIGRFVKEAKQQPWWKNTLVVIVADHGHKFPGNDANEVPSKFHIPLLFTGGALAVQDTVITSIGSQTDLVPTLLQQLGLPNQQFAWSKNLLDAKATPFAFYVYNDGFGMVSPQGVVTFDNVSKKPIKRDAKVPDQQLEQGKAYMQLSYEDYMKK